MVGKQCSDIFECFGLLLDKVSLIFFADLLGPRDDDFKVILDHVQYRLAHFREADHC